MKLESIHIENFRSFKDETINFDDYTCLVGPNGGGKSTVLCALNIFFRETENSATDVVSLSAEDFHHKDTSHPVKVTVTFKDLSAEAQEDFKAYFRQGKLMLLGFSRKLHSGLSVDIDDVQVIPLRQGQHLLNLGIYRKGLFLLRLARFTGIQAVTDGLGDFYGRASDLGPVKRRCFHTPHIQPEPAREV